MVSLAVVYVRSRPIAEEVAQDTWIAVLNGIDRFEGRSSLKTWIYRILINRAMTRGKRENRCLAFSSVWEQAGRSSEAAVDPARFISASGASSGAWAAAPRPWEDQPEQRLLCGEVRERLDEAIAQLPDSQRTVITLRDVEGWSSSEVCNTLDISETNQRVLLHRARAKVRRAMEGYLEHV
jgi:RNA polymerase sigma-70 factor (ECF subfamily)